MLRFAPSPTGDMHIGDLRLAIFNYIASRQREEDFIVRIEDVDIDQNTEGKDQEILDILSLFGIVYSQIIHQSQNVRFHSAMALQLMHERKAFSCFCSPQWIENKKEEAIAAKQVYKYDDACRNLPAELVIDNTNPFTIRITRPNKAIYLQDKIKGEISFKCDDVDSFIVLKQDKTPTANFASAVDDMLNDISLVIREEKHLNNTPKQEHIRNSLAYDKKIEYAHIPTILNADSFSIKQLLEDGFLPISILNYLVSIANSTPKEIFTLDEAIKFFDLQTISNDPVTFSTDRLKEINKAHLQKLDAKELSRYVGFADEEIGKLAYLYLEDEVFTTKELKTKIAPIFAKRNIPEKFSQTTMIIKDCIMQAPYFENYEDFISHIKTTTGLGENDILVPLRLLLTNAENGPKLSNIYMYLKNYLGEIIK